MDQTTVEDESLKSASGEETSSPFFLCVDGDERKARECASFTCTRLSRGHPSISKDYQQSLPVPAMQLSFFILDQVDPLSRWGKERMFL